MLQLRQKDAPAESAIVLTKKTVIGSHELADFVIEGADGHADVWPTHCVISKAGSKFLLMALDPHAEVLVNGAAVQQGAVNLGDVISIGGFDIHVEAAHTEVGDEVDALLKRTQDEAKRQAERKSRRLEKSKSTDAPAKPKDEDTGKRKLTRRYKKQSNPFGQDTELDAAFGEDAAAAAAEAAKVAEDFGLPPIDGGGGFGNMGAGMPELPVAGETKLPPPPPEPQPEVEPEEITPVADAIAARVEAESGRRPAAPAVDPADDDADLVSPDDPLLLPKDDLPKRTTRRKTKTVVKGKRTASGRMQAVGKDGKLDVDMSIRAHSKRVSAAELAKKADTVRILNYSTIKGLIDDSVAEAMNLVGAKLDEKERKALLKEAEDEFKARLEGFKAEKAGLEAQAANLRSQLDKASNVLEEERGRTVETSSFTVSEKGMEDLEANFMRMLKGAVEGEGIPKSLQAQLEGMISKLLDNEREKIAEQAKAAQSEAIALLEKKVRRLAGGLEEAEAERDRQSRRAKALESAGGKGIANVAEVGLEDDDPDAERKLELLRAVFEQNRQLRESLGQEMQSFEEVQAASKKRAAELKERKAKERAELQAELDEERAAAGDTADDTADDEPEPEEPQAAEEPVEELDPADDPYAGLVDPDDEVWQPGMSFSTEPKGDDEDDDGADVNKITDYKKFEPPPLERKK